MAHFYIKRFTDFLPELTQISKPTFTRINDIIMTIYSIFETVTTFWLISSYLYLLPCMNTSISMLLYMKNLLKISLSLRLVGFSTLFSNFFDNVWMPATLLIILWFRSNFRSDFVRWLSFLGEKTELIYLHYSPFYTYLCTVVKICAKKVQNVVRTVKNRIFIF